MDFMKAIGESGHNVTDHMLVQIHQCVSPLNASSGLPDDLIEKGKDIKSVSEIEQNGDHFKVTVTTGAKVLTNAFTIGQEADIETLTGEKVKVTDR